MTPQAAAFKKMCYDELKKEGPVASQRSVVRGPPVADLLQEGRSNTAAVTLSYASTLSLQPGIGMHLILHSTSSVDFSVASHFELHQLLCGEAEATSCATKTNLSSSVSSVWEQVGQAYCCSPPIPEKTEGLHHTRTSFPADVPAEAGSSNLNSWAGASLKTKKYYLLLFILLLSLA